MKLELTPDPAMPLLQILASRFKRATFRLGHAQLSTVDSKPLAEYSFALDGIEGDSIPSVNHKTSVPHAALRKASLLPFVFVMYAYATGGPFGLEDMVTTSGPGLTLLYHLFIPLFWCIPVSLVAAELTTAIPVEGGFYRWVRA